MDLAPVDLRRGKECAIHQKERTSEALAAADRLDWWVKQGQTNSTINEMNKPVRSAEYEQLLAEERELAALEVAAHHVPTHSAMEELEEEERRLAKEAAALEFERIAEEDRLLAAKEAALELERLAEEERQLAAMEAKKK